MVTVGFATGGAVTVTCDWAEVVPPVPVTTSFSACVAVGEIVKEPDVATAAPLSVALVALALFQLTTAFCPAVIDEGEADMDAVGAGLLAAFTVN